MNKVKLFPYIIIVYRKNKPTKYYGPYISIKRAWNKLLKLYKPDLDKKQEKYNNINWYMINYSSIIIYILDKNDEKIILSDYYIKRLND